MMTIIDGDHRSVSPQIRTPDTDSQHVEHPPSRSFGKDDSTVNKDAHCQAPPISLLTSLLQQTSEHRLPTSTGQQAYSSGITSAHSSLPSTAFSSPRNPPQVNLHQGHMSDSHVAPILRRRSESTESESAPDGIVGLGFGGLDATSGLRPVEEKRERIEWADRVEDHPGATSRNGHCSGLKFAVSHIDSRSLPLARPPAPSHSRDAPHVTSRSGGEESEDTDEGYQEDEEDGFDSDSEDDDDELRYPFARSTNFDKKRFIGSTLIPVTSPAPAPALLPPPSRRGRGHIRVNEPISVPGDPAKSCSRHRSPPPTPSRQSDASTSGEGRRASRSTNRLSDAGPRDGRAGSPMPGRLSSDTDQEDEEAELGESIKLPSSATGGFGGWRSDDAVFYGTRAQQVVPITAPHHRRRSVGHDQTSSVFIDSDDEGRGEAYDGGTSFRGFLRRASEHIAGLARPASPMLPRNNSRGSRRRSRPSFSVPLPSQALCPPALDDTPAMAQGLSVVDYGNTSGPLAHRLESSLNVQPE